MPALVILAAAVASAILILAIWARKNPSDSATEEEWMDAIH